MGLFGENKKITPAQKIREMQSKLRRESYKMDRDISTIARTVKSQEMEIKKYAKANNIAAAKLIAKEILNARKAINRLYCAKAEMNSVSMSLSQQVGLVRVVGNLEKSTEILKCMSSLVKIPEIQGTMQELSKEMMKAGLIEELITDTIESSLGMDEAEMEDAADVEVQKVLFEITEGKIGAAPEAVFDSLPPASVANKPSTSKSTGQEVGADDVPDDISARLAALRN